MYSEEATAPEKTATVPRLRAGNYRAAARKAQMAETKDGKPQVAVEFDLLDMENERIAWYGYFTDKTKERTIQALLYCGWDGDDWTTFNGIGNNEVELVIEHDTYDGKTRAKVAWVNRRGLVVEKPMTTEQALSFAERMRGEVLAVKQKTKVSSSPVAPRPGASRGPDEGGELRDDDIPF